MTRSCCVLALLLASCTTVYSPATGKRLFRTYSDARELSFTAGSGANAVALHVVGLSHSRPIIAAGKSASGVIGAVGGAATALGLGLH